MKWYTRGFLAAVLVEIISFSVLWICDYYRDGLSCLLYAIPGFWPVVQLQEIIPGNGVLQEALVLLITTAINTILYGGIIALALWVITKANSFKK